MNSIVKIALALKLKFLLIVLSIGGCYLMEHRIIKHNDAVPDIEIIQPVSNLQGQADTNPARISGTSDHFHLQPVNYVANRPFSYQGLEIYIVL